MHYPLSGWSVPMYVFLECISLLLLVHIATKSMTRVPGFSLGRAHRAYSQLILKPINLLSGCWLGCLTPHQSSWGSVRQHQLFLWLAGDSPRSKNKERKYKHLPLSNWPKTKRLHALVTLLSLICKWKAFLVKIKEIEKKKRTRFYCYLWRFLKIKFEPPHPPTALAEICLQHKRTVKFLVITCFSVLTEVFNPVSADGCQISNDPW